ncbi:MAG: ATP-binding cassette domain-containing protein [Methylibium sp.]|uniref:ABC-F family ATP-binding cassette domain-containing protein n=1 Tax=Methylibium sp. TaxID=2067992 RepID=UPI001813E2FD|nr:ATP-binding cassette domain-containing protein [Methylibium sp.]MBA2724210.1 ATP-binding cassette domain-containing protein [Methylibium sp.]MBA3590434.1 ATP-binding cassette domain-containing protein [Methylibium sp.]
MITLRNLILRRGPKVVLAGASVTLNPGEKIGLVGRNGAGKSSLFALMTGKLGADAGDFSMPPRWRMAEVVQHMPETDQPATDFVLDGDTRLTEANAALAAAEEADDGHAIGDAHALLAEVGAFDARPRAQALMLGLGFKSGQLDAPVNSFSGGWRMRLQLARALMCPSDLLLLDEPTNHLDLDALVWLEAWLQRYEGTMLVISHDREFLDAITKVTLHLDEAQLTRYGGNYSAFELMRAERMNQQQAAFGRQQDKVAQLQRFIDRFKAKASKAKQAQSRVKALERMEKIAPVLTSADFSFEFKEPANLPNPMLAMREMACGYRVTGAEPITIVRDINRSVMPGQRIGILGANGQGKSTLVKTLARMQPALSGSVTEGKGLAIGYFAQQEMDLLTPDSGPMEHMIRLAKQVSPNAREQELRNFLGQFRFTGDMVHQQVGSLSGGEKARLVLAMLVWQRPNLLLLDEPTNHLDLTTREALSMALNEFEGTVMLVSHDRALLREVCDEFWLVTAGGIQEFDGDLDDYQRWLLEQSREQAKAYAQAQRAGASSGGAASAALRAPALVAAPPPAPVPSSSPATSGDPARRRDDRKAQAQQRQKAADQARPLRQELATIEARMAKASALRDAVAARLADPALQPASRAEQGRELKLLEGEIATLEARWLEVGESIDASNAAA